MGKKVGLPGIVAGLLWVAACNVAAQGTAYASLQPDRVETGDTVSLFVLVSGVNAQPVEVNFGSWASIFPAANIIARSGWKRSGNQWAQRYTLISFDSATLDLPPLTVKPAIGDPMKTNALRLTVFPTPGSAETADMEKIRDIRRESVLWTDHWPWAAGALVLMALLIWWMRKTRKKPKPTAIVQPAAAPPVPPHERALRQLIELKSRQLWKSGQVKEHYAELSLILREYLESRYNIPALESTTIEILKMLSEMDLPQNLNSRLKEILSGSDLVKYARSMPGDNYHEKVLDQTRELVVTIDNKQL